MTTLALTAYAVMALAWTGAAALLLGGWARERAVRRLGGTVDAQDGAAGIPQPSERPDGPTPALREAYRIWRETTGAAADRPHVWPGPVLPDAALSGLARHEAADWTGWRPSYDGEDVDPGRPWRAGE